MPFKIILRGQISKNEGKVVSDIKLIKKGAKMGLIITKHAFKRARARFGLNKKAFIRVIKSGKIPAIMNLITKNEVIVTVKNLAKVENRRTRKKVSKKGRMSANTEVRA